MELTHKGKLKVSDLEGALLDYWVGRGCELPGLSIDDAGAYYVNGPENSDGHIQFVPSTNWGQGGPIIERERIQLIPPDRPAGPWRANRTTWPDQPLIFSPWEGPTPLSAAMKAYVAWKFGSEVPAWPTTPVPGD